jgi:NTE family protein
MPTPVPAHHKKPSRPPFECIALLLQGGGALGAYQAGVYEALAEADLHPDWTAGISIGAINAALIAGNAPESRVERLRQFWELITEPFPIVNGGSTAGAVKGKDAQTGAIWDFWQQLTSLAFNGRLYDLGSQMVKGDAARAVLNQLNAARAVMVGAAGFFAPRVPGPWLYPDGSLEATSFYDTGFLKATLERLVDFDRINADGMRLSVGAVNVRTGNLVYFDSASDVIRPEHVMASGALPPGFAAIEIDGEHYWDGGVVSNTPLEWVVQSKPLRDTLAFQVDLWSATGEFPRNLTEVSTRQKEIQYSSRTRANSDRFKQTQVLRNAVASLIEKLPAELKSSPDVALLKPAGVHKVYSLIELTYRAHQYEGGSKDYEFSRLSMEDHWRSGYNDTIRALRHPEALERPRNVEGVFILDAAEDGRK